MGRPKLYSDEEREVRRAASVAKYRDSEHYRKISRDQQRRARTKRGGEINAGRRENYVGKKLYVLGLLGNECAHCYSGALDLLGYLQIDHVKDDGNEERAKGRTDPIAAVIADLARFGLDGLRSVYQLLCPHCHAVKTLYHRTQLLESKLTSVGVS